MRIHTNTLTRRDVYDAARIARVDLATFDDHGSKSRRHAFNIKLEGSSRRRPNGGASGAGTGYAATWDQWGVFLAVLFDRDRDMVTPYDADADAFHRRTNDRFDNHGNMNVVDYWPTDAHGDHTFRFAGRPGEQSCTKCSAVSRWS